MKKVKYCFLLEKRTNTQLQLLDATVIEQKPRVKYAVNTSSSSIVQKKPGAGNCSEMGSEGEEGNRFFGDSLGFFFFFFLSQSECL